MSEARFDMRRHLAAHWRGALPLHTSAALHWALPALVLVLAIDVLAASVAVDGPSLRAASIALLIAGAALCALTAWGAVGTWRAAAAGTTRGRAVGWCVAARVGVALGLAATLGAVMPGVAPRATDLARQAAGVEPLGHVDAALSDGGRRLTLRGPIGAGDAARVRRLIAQAPGLQRVELESPGGRFDEARTLADAIHGRAVLTRATGACDHACALVFMAGERRQLMPGARLGFHRVAAGGIGPLAGRLSNARLATLYRSAALPEAFVRKTLSTPPARLWVPEADELVDARIVTLPARPLDVELPRADDAPVDDYVDALAANPLWERLDRRFPQSAAAAGRRMHAARAQGGADDEVQLAAHGVAEALLGQLLFNASPELRARYVELLSDQLAAAGSLGADACSRVLAGDAAARRRLPPELAGREAAWLLHALNEPVRDSPLRRPSAPELEVVRRSLGHGAPALLSAMRRADAGGRSDCGRVLRLLGDVGKLPPPERRLAIRLMFES